MFTKTNWALGLALYLSAAQAAHADNSAAEIQQLKDRLQTLESQVSSKDASAPATVSAAPAAANGNAFNPKISLILNGTYANYSADSTNDLGGFLLGGESGPEKGLSLGETELAIEANVDQTFHGWTALSVSPDGGIDVEEAYVNTLALPAGFTVKLGRFFSDIGYQNHQHAHAWEFTDAPLVYRAMLGGKLGDDGLQVRWIAPTDLFVELGAEALRGASFPAGGDSNNGIKAYTGFAHVGGDVGASGSWRLGVSNLHANADDRRTEANGTDSSFTGSSNLSIIDAVYKWAPNGNASNTNFIGQAEYFYRHEKGDVIADPDGLADTSLYSGHQQGFYLQGVYQFMPRWRTGLRYDNLSANNTLSNPATGTALETLASTKTAQRYSLMTDFSNSEFSRVRLQYNYDLSRANGQADHQVFAQYIFSLGSHPAHQF